MKGNSDIGYIKKDSSVYRVTDSDTDKTLMNNWTLGPVSGWSKSDISESQKNDKVVSCVLNWLKQRPEEEATYGSSKELWSYWHQYDRVIINDDVLYRIWWKNGIQEVPHFQLVLLKPKKEIALYSLHDYTEHLGCGKTIGKPRERYYWFNLRVETKIYINQCIVCQQTKHPQRKTQNTTKKYQVWFSVRKNLG